MIYLIVYHVLVFLRSRLKTIDRSLNVKEPIGLLAAGLLNDCHSIEQTNKLWLEYIVNSYKLGTDANCSTVTEPRSS